jgi:hypothetical protein
MKQFLSRKKYYIQDRTGKYIAVLEVKSLDSSVGLAAGYGLDGRGSILSRDYRFSSTPQGPDQP